MKNRKASSHLEIILSFVIFAGFLIFLFAIFQPTKFSKKNEADLDTLERSIRERISIPLSFFTIKTDENSGCFYIEYALNNDEKVIVKDKTRKMLNAKSSDGMIYVNSGGNNFFYIYLSKEFEESGGDFSECQVLDKLAYSVGLLRAYDVVSYKALEELKEDYLGRYEGLKSELSISTSHEFAFVLKDSAGSEIISGRKRISEVQEVLARDIPIEVIYYDGTSKIAILNIQIW